jgi:hypothetical protein
MMQGVGGTGRGAVRTDGVKMFFNRGLIKAVRLPLDDPYRILRALSETGSETVAEVVGGQNRLAVDNRDRPFGAGRNAESTAVTFVRID